MSGQLYQDDHENDCAYCGKDFAELKATNKALVEALKTLTEKVEALPVEEWVETEELPHGQTQAILIGYVMQATGEWDDVCDAVKSASALIEGVEGE